MSSVSNSPGSAPASATGENAPVAGRPGLRDGSVTVASLIDAFMVEYAGRDGTRAQRLDWWRERIGHLTVAELDDDHVFEAIEALARRPGAYFAGRDIEGRAIMRARRKPLSAASRTGIRPRCHRS